MLDWLSGDDDDDDAPAESDSPGEDLLGDADWEDDGDLGGMGDMDDELGFDDMEDDGQAVGELSNRVDSMEEEIGKMSSTVNTIKHENEEMGTDLEEVQDNVRKLLEIYEMVTRGVNPFVDDDPFETNDTSFDLFGDEGDEGAGDESVDGADEFGDDFGDMDDFAFDDEEDDLLDDDEDELLDDDEDDLLDDDLDDGADDGEGGRSFDELKEEYESGDADWDDPDDAEDDPPDTDDEPDFDAGPDGDTDPVEELADPVERADGFDAHDKDNSMMGILGEKPYLATLPEGYAVDLIVMEWLEELDEHLEEGSAGDVIEYYRAIGWISNDVAEQLQAFAPGLSDVDFATEPQPGSVLPVAVHKTSLRYIHRLATTTSRRVVVTDAGVEDLPGGEDPDLNQLADEIALAARTDGGSFWAAIEGFDSSRTSRFTAGDQP